MPIAIGLRCLSLQDRIEFQLQISTRYKVADWVRTECTALLFEDRSKRKEVSNYWPITCLPLVWKLLICIAAGELHNHLEESDL